MNRELEKKPFKIVVKQEDELTDIVRKISQSKSEQIVLTFAQPSDLLVSPVNFKVLLESADEEGKSIVAQIIQNPSGIRNASQAGVVTTSYSGDVSDELWENAYEDMFARNQSKERVLKNIKSGGEPAITTIKKKVEEEEKAMVEQATSSEIVDDDEPLIIDNANSDDEVEEVVEKTPEQIRSDEFKKRIDQALARSREGILSKNKTVESGGLMVALDHEITDQESRLHSIKKTGNEVLEQEERSNDLVEDLQKTPADGGQEKPKVVVLNNNAPKQNRAKTLVGVDMGGEKESGASQSAHEVSAPRENVKLRADKLFASSSGNGRAARTSGGGVMAPIIGKLNAFLKEGGNNRKKLLFLLAPVVLFMLLIMWGIYSFAPLANVEIFIESRPVQIEQTFTGDSTVSEIDLLSSKVPIKQEVVTKERGESAATTGTGARGDKASGVVSVKCFMDGTQVIAAGTVLTAKSLQFTFVNDVSVVCPDIVTATVVASDVGSEYNLPSGTTFAISGYNSSQIIAVNDGSALTGGNKEEFRAVAQGDIDNLKNSLQSSAFAEAKDELMDKNKDGWVLVEASIKEELDGDPESDFPVGAEADLVNVSLKTKSSALYYKKSEIDKVVEQLLLSKAEDENLFDSEEGLDLKLDKDINADVAVEGVSDTAVNLKLVASGMVIPTVDKDQVVRDLKGKDWEKGVKYLADLEYVAKPSTVKFSPDYFPKGLRYFPDRQGRIILKVTEVEAQE